jgi:hypothetical protein
MPKSGSILFGTGAKRAALKTAGLCSGLLFFAVAALRPADFSLKLLAGWTNSGLHYDYDSLSRINRPGFGAGFEVWFFKWVGLEVDALYAVRGYRWSGEPEDRDFAALSFPVLLKGRFFFDRAATISFSLFGGGSYDRFLTKMDQDFDQHDFGIVAGASLEKRLGKVGLLLEGRYEWGLNYQSDEYFPDRFSFKTRTFFLLAGISLHL